MNWTEFLQGEADAIYGAALGLMDLVDEDQLDWRPESGDNWMSTGQLLHHLTEACGHCCRCFLTGDWGMPEDMSEEDMLPPADRLPTTESVAAARAGLEADRATFDACVAEAGEERLGTEMHAAPWNPQERPLGLQFKHMLGHLEQHKGQLFYYLKLQGKPVHTGTLYGM